MWLLKCGKTFCGDTWEMTSFVSVFNRNCEPPQLLASLHIAYTADCIHGVPTMITNRGAEGQIIAPFFLDRDVKNQTKRACQDVNTNGSIRLNREGGWVFFFNAERTARWKVAYLNNMSSLRFTSSPVALNIINRYAIAIIKTDPLTRKHRKMSIFYRRSFFPVRS